MRSSPRPDAGFAPTLFVLALAGMTQLEPALAQSASDPQTQSENPAQRGQTADASSTSTASEGLFRVVETSTSVVEGVHRLDADLELEFSKDAQEAIENGVPMSIVIEMEVLRERAIWDEVIARPGAQFRVENHPLTTLYVIRNVDSGVARTFRTRANMMEALGAVRDLEVVPDEYLDPAERYRLRVRVRLDIEALPAPLRPLAYLSSTWRLRSEWHTQSLRPQPSTSRASPPSRPEGLPTVDNPDAKRPGSTDP